jgi:hypothetical protein
MEIQGSMTRRVQEMAKDWLSSFKNVWLSISIYWSQSIFMTDKGIYLFHSFIGWEGLEPKRLLRFGTTPLGCQTWRTITSLTRSIPSMFFPSLCKESRHTSFITSECWITSKFKNDLCIFKLKSCFVLFNSVNCEKL